MGYLSGDEQVLEKLKNFIGMLNEEAKKGSVIVVEGRRDAEALSSIGFTGSLALFHNFKGIADFVDCHGHEKKKIILLLDMDRTGKYLTSRLIMNLQSHRNHVSLFYKHALAKITNGKVRHVEDLSTYASQMAGVTGARKDLYFYT